MSDVAVETAAIEAPAETPVVEQPVEAPRTPAEIRQQTRDRASGRVAAQHNRGNDKPRDESGRFVASESEPTPEAAQAEPASTEAAPAPSKERIELPDGHPLRERGKQYFDELSNDELRSIINTPVRARELDEAKREASQLKQQIARIEAERDTWKTQTFSVLQDPKVAATYAELKAVDETIANQWLRGVQQEMEGQVSSQLLEVDAQAEMQQFMSGVETSARSRYPDWYVGSPEFVTTLRRAVFQYGNDLTFREKMGEQVTPDATGVWEYMDRLFLSSPDAKERARQSLTQKQSAEATRIKREAEEALEKKQKEELEAVAARRSTNALGRIPNAHTGQQLPNGAPRSPAEIRQHVRNRARGVR